VLTAGACCCLQEDFLAASEHVRLLTSRPTNDELLLLYGLFKQATQETTAHVSRWQQRQHAARPLSAAAQQHSGPGKAKQQPGNWLSASVCYNLLCGHPSSNICSAFKRFERPQYKQPQHEMVRAAAAGTDPDTAQSLAAMRPPGTTGGSSGTA
jgi:hypothetical protein